jgi:hypothetical protein
MGRTIAESGLTRATRFAMAEDADEAGIRRLLRENSMPGAVSVTFEREPDYFHGTGLAGGVDQTIVAYEENRLSCMGRCTRRHCWVDGRARRVGYLSELRLDARARRRFIMVRDGYRFFRQQSWDDLLFTSIASDNARARRLLESGVRGLPAYEFLGELMTLLIAVPRHARASGLRVEPATAADLPGVVRLLNGQGQRYQFATVWTEVHLRGLAAHGLTIERMQLAKVDGQLVACGALWDQRGFRQTVIRGYAGPLRVALPLVNLTHQLLRRPRLPAPGTVLAQAFLSPLAFEAGAEELLSAFVEAFFPLAASATVEWLTLALPARDVRVQQLRRRFHVRTWPSRLYRVVWPESAAPEDLARSTPLLPDVALL